MRKIFRIMSMLILLIVAVIGSFFLPRRDLRATSQVAGIALDEENGLLKATFELYDPDVEEPIGKNRKIVSAVGSSIKECADSAQKLWGKELFINDVSVLILSSEKHAFLLQKVKEHYSQLQYDQMDLPVFFAFGQRADAIFQGEGEVISSELTQSGKKLHKIQTVLDLMNGSGERILIKGEGGYEIIS